MLDADVVLSCTDTQHGRLAIADLASRFLVPAIDVGVVLEGGEGVVSAQVIQLRRQLAADPWTARDLLRVSRVSPWTLRLGALG